MPHFPFLPTSSMHTENANGADDFGEVSTKDRPDCDEHSDDSNEVWAAREFLKRKKQRKSSSSDQKEASEVSPIAPLSIGSAGEYGGAHAGGSRAPGSAVHAPFRIELTQASSNTESYLLGVARADAVPDLFSAFASSVQAAQQRAAVPEAPQPGSATDNLRVSRGHLYYFQDLPPDLFHYLMGWLWRAKAKRRSRYNTDWKYPDFEFIMSVPIFMFMNFIYKRRFVE